MIFRILSLLLAAFVVVWALGPGRTHAPAVNPDPNHTHADFAVWVRGKQIDFSLPKYMSGLSTDAVHDETHSKYFHLHDANGRVIHRHKPDLSLGEFFTSIGFGFGSKVEDEWCWYALQEKRPFAACESGPMKLYVNGKLTPGNPADYVFADNDKLLLTDALLQDDITYQLGLLSNDACLYSRTCPERGDPPTENCIADPEVPCKI